MVTVPNNAPGKDDFTFDCVRLSIAGKPEQKNGQGALLLKGTFFWKREIFLTPRSD